MISSDCERALAALTLEQKILPATITKKIIEDGRKDKTKGFSELFAHLKEEDILQAIAKGMGIQFYNLFSTVQEYRVDNAVVARADMKLLRQYSALPMVGRNGQIVVAVANPDIDVVDYLRSRYLDGFALVLAQKSQIQNKLAYFGVDNNAANAFKDDPNQITLQAISTQPLPDRVAGRSPVLDWVDSSLSRAVAENASDVHVTFNPDKTINLRFRVDGVLRKQQVPVPADRSLEVVGAILAKTETMDPSNYREPQDGTFTFFAAGRQIDARVGMLPQIYGPNVVIRLLDSAAVKQRLDDMGFAPRALEYLRTATSMPAGTVVVSGPTGSGKSTTLYGLVREIDSITQNVLTVEDPVEYKLPNIGQTAIRHDLGDKSLTFARALRSILRLDPDVILVGEIRDAETARVAMDASITGHLVLSTVHAPNAVGVYARLMEMGVPSYLVAEAITLPTAQRLVRKVHECVKMGPPDPYEAKAIRDMGEVVPDQVALPQGCLGCTNGYRGRLAVFEVFVPDRAFRSAVARKADIGEMQEAAIATGTYQSLLEDGMRLVREGKTSLSEVLRVLATEERI